MLDRERRRKTCTLNSATCFQRRIIHPRRKRILPFLIWDQMTVPNHPSGQSFPSPRRSWADAYWLLPCPPWFCPLFVGSMESIQQIQLVEKIPAIRSVMPAGGGYDGSSNESWSFCREALGSSSFCSHNETRGAVIQRSRRGVG